MTTQLLLSGTPEELQTILGLLAKPNGETKVFENKPKTKSKPKTKPESPELFEVTIEEIRSAVQAKSKAGKREEIKKLLKEFSAASVTELDEESYEEFMSKLSEL